MDLFDTFFGELLMTFLIAMVPVLELRGAIPAGIAAGLPPSSAISFQSPFSFFCSAAFLAGCANPAGLDRKSTGWSAGHTSRAES